MTHIMYPFIDLAVHDAIRKPFSNGEALAIVTTDFSSIIWANGPAAELFGHQSIYDFMDEGFIDNKKMRKKLRESAKKLSEKGASNNASQQISSKTNDRKLDLTLQLLQLPKGEDAILVIINDDDRSPRGILDVDHIISGFADTGSAMAVLGKQGQILGATDQFYALDVSLRNRRALTQDVSQEEDRLVKRPLNTIKGELPSAIGYLSENPDLYLLVTVDPDIDESMTENISTGPTSSPVPEMDIVSQDLSQPHQPEDSAEMPAEPIETAQDDIALSKTDILPDTADEPDDDAIEETNDLTSKKPDDIIGDPSPVVPALVAPVMSPIAPPSVCSDMTVNISGDVSDDLSDDETINAFGDDASDDISDEPDLKAGDFVFNRHQKAVRFIWKTDAAGIFTEISPELGQAIGPNAVDVLGRRFADVALVFNLHPSEEIIDLIRRRDTWSGKTVNWPVQGTNQSVPVDLAALPTYTRDRLFDGYRGFGIARIQEAKEDKDAIGSALNPGSYDDTLDAKAAFEAESNDDNDPSTETDTPQSDAYNFITGSHSNKDDASDTDDQTQDPYRGETPAIDTSNNPKRRSADKVVQLDQLRREARDELTKEEKAAFLEISKQLSKINDEKISDDPASIEEADKTYNHDDVSTDPMNTLDPANELSDDHNSENDVYDQADEQPSPEHIGEPNDKDEKQAPTRSYSDQEANQPLENEASLEAEEQTASETEHHIGLPSLAAAEATNPVLIYIGDELLHANTEFFDLTGYENLDQIQDLGGIEYLLTNPFGYSLDEDIPIDDDIENEDMTLRLCDDTIISINANMQSVVWGDRAALLLEFDHTHDDENDGENDDKFEDSLKNVHAAPFFARASAEDLNLDDRDEPDVGTNTDADADNGQDESDQDALERLKVKVADLTSILETATDGVVIINEDSQIQSLNASASALFDYNMDEVVGQPFAMLFAAESQHAILDYVNSMGEHGVASILNDGREVTGRVSSGGTLPLSMTIGKLSGSSGYCAVLRDITQSKNAEEELRHAKSEAESSNSHKTDFLARVSHEIRTPLNAIIGFADLIAQERFGPAGHPRYVEYSHDISKSGRHVLDIVNDLLDISKIEAGQQDLDFQSVSLNDEVSEALSLLQQIANENRVIVRSSLPANIPKVVADKRSIKQILLNILSNSIRFTPAGGQIVVSSSIEATGHVFVRIRDNGVGMSRSELDRAMQPFGQVGQETRQRGDGTGLGLPLTRAMTEANRAKFDIVSAPGEGTLVTIDFPPQRVLTD
jgi:PAS domain S-box-containing protein